MDWAVGIRELLLLEMKLNHPAANTRFDINAALQVLWMKDLCKPLVTAVE